jgi:hypothetical protein
MARYRRQYKGMKIKFKIPFLGEMEHTWEPDEAEIKAAWEMYVELVTRVSVVGLPSGEGLLREALSSLYTIFGTTRQILRSYGPSVATPSGDSDISFGQIAVTVLNDVLRPFLTKWHPLLLDYENQRASGVSPVEHESAWPSREDARRELDGVRLMLRQYADLLASVAGVPSLVSKSEGEIAIRRIIG